MRSRTHNLPHAEKNDNENIKKASMMSGIKSGRGGSSRALFRNGMNEAGGPLRMRAPTHISSRFLKNLDAGQDHPPLEQRAR